MRNSSWLSLIFFILSFLIMVPIASQADVCSENACPRGRKKSNVCIIDPALWSGPIWKANSSAACGYFSEKKVAGSLREVSEKLNEFAKECIAIDRLIFQGHGDDGFSSVGDLDNGSVGDLKKYACLFGKGASIDFAACSVGKGCSGDMLVLRTAQTLLPLGGKVSAPTTYISTFFPGVIPPFPRNGKYRVLEYAPSSKPPDRWTQTGLAITNGGSINDRCSSEIKSLVSDLDEAKADAQKKRCSSSNNFVSTQQVASYREIEARLSKSPPYLQTASSEVWYDISQALTRMKYQIQRYETCEPPTDTTTGAGQREDGVR